MFRSKVATVALSWLPRAAPRVPCTNVSSAVKPSPFSLLSSTSATMQTRTSTIDRNVAAASRCGDKLYRRGLASSTSDGTDDTPRNFSGCLDQKFYDWSRITAISGNGGNGCSSMRREKFVEFGGPDGGHGGRGGSVIIRASESVADLRMDRFHFKAKHGQNGRGKAMQGSHGEDLVIEVPVGTIVKRIIRQHRMIDEDGVTIDWIDTPEGEAPEQQVHVLADLDEHGQQHVVARGGRPGRGNIAFKTEQDPAPRVCTAGEPGQEVLLECELKLVADIGFVGFPNVGKSTLLGALSTARPKVADYPFTTIRPYIGVVVFPDFFDLTIADLPGLLEGAHEGRGLGFRFLRHVERTRCLAYVIDVSRGDPYEQYRALQNELRLYDGSLMHRESIVILNKSDSEGSKDLYQALVQRLAEEGDTAPVLRISALHRAGLKTLLQTCRSTVVRQRKIARKIKLSAESNARLAGSTASKKGGEDWDDDDGDDDVFMNWPVYGDSSPPSSSPPPS